MNMIFFIIKKENLGYIWFMNYENLFCNNIYFIIIFFLVFFLEILFGSLYVLMKNVVSFNRKIIGKYCYLFW